MSGNEKENRERKGKWGMTIMSGNDKGNGD